MGSKLIYVGLTMIVAVAPFWDKPYIKIAGAIIMTIGVVLYCLDK